MYLKCRECGYEFSVPESYRRLKSTWCRYCGGKVYIIDPIKDKKATKELYIGLGMLIGVLISLFWGLI